ncbi:cyclic-phosphate processing receiver domain-containing protein [Pseudalkalibacillus decolorationis]|uniref:cyclic-phosphate processing receiver domain-containing protein n=1 Tax=Pseudalkalibacillus decolorationis TaxID=163879 RepID=UPI002149443E|nr:cyclic-phosphate processing receiver domain-containing protein [Pseudalkalibacillus decolorationis]
MSKINVFLDDVRPCPEHFILATDIEQCIQLLNEFDVQHLSLDHDLENKVRNGFLLVQHMVKHQLFAETITVHSANSGAGKRMYSYLINAQEQHLIPDNVKIFYYPLPLNRLNDQYPLPVDLYNR